MHSSGLPWVALELVQIINTLESTHLHLHLPWLSIFNVFYIFKNERHLSKKDSELRIKLSRLVHVMYAFSHLESHSTSLTFRFPLPINFLWYITYLLADRLFLKGGQIIGMILLSAAILQLNHFSMKSVVIEVLIQ